MRVFKLVFETCITGIARYDFKYSKNCESKQMRLQREKKNKYDRNAIVVKLDNEKIGYIKKDQARVLAPILDANSLKVKKWLCDEECSTPGFLIAQLYLVS